eukprot:TRINITY_DN7570_c1_g1_i1.p2 TRINITY_DN7570_c1_g1~~TRINITY_DN7570_c1_g1_i1.p2  ORF type:complete len:149 (+),score=0.19 TRINITY_DN7570_c1_g1_i1:235-681(+)
MCSSALCVDDIPNLHHPTSPLFLMLFLFLFPPSPLHSARVRSREHGLAPGTPASPLCSVTTAVAKVCGALRRAPLRHPFPRLGSIPSCGGGAGGGQVAWHLRFSCWHSWACHHLQHAVRWVAWVDVPPCDVSTLFCSPCTPCVVGVGG